MVRAGEVSPTELVGQSWIGSSGSTRELNSFRKVFAEQAMLEAEQAEARLKAGRSGRCSGCRSRSRTKSTWPAR